jgi:hypothetical protein
MRWLTQESRIMVVDMLETKTRKKKNRACSEKENGRSILFHGDRNGNMERYVYWFARRKQTTRIDWVEARTGSSSLGKSTETCK